MYAVVPLNSGKNELSSNCKYPAIYVLRIAVSRLRCFQLRDMCLFFLVPHILRHVIPRSVWNVVHHFGEIFIFATSDNFKLLFVLYLLAYYLNLFEQNVFKYLVILSLLCRVRELCFYCSRIIRLPSPGLGRTSGSNLGFGRTTGSNVWVEPRWVALLGRTTGWNLGGSHFWVERLGRTSVVKPRWVALLGRTSGSNFGGKTSVGRTSGSNLVFGRTSVLVEPVCKPKFRFKYCFLCHKIFKSNS